MVFQWNSSMDKYITWHIGHSETEIILYLLAILINNQTKMQFSY